MRLDMDLLQQHRSWKVYGQIAPGLFWEEDVRPSCGAGPAVGGRGLEEDLGGLCCWAAGGDGAYTEAIIWG